MGYGICLLSTIPMRKEPFHESELVSELLFNDLYKIVDKSTGWLKIKTDFDAYKGWIRNFQHHEITHNEYDKYKNKKHFIITAPVTNYHGKILSFGSTCFEESIDSIAIPETFDSNKMVEYAKKLKDIPYRWGGKTVFGIDCSAFVQLCAKAAGFKLPRDTSQQVNAGEIIYFLSESQAGDLAFFKNEENHIVHVGILLSNETIIHASGKVRIDSLDPTGIFNKETGRHTHFLSVIKRLS